MERADFKKMVREFREQEQATVGTQAIEPMLLSILESIKEVDGKPQWLVEEFVSLVHDELPPYEVIAFCMRELQWPEVQKALEERTRQETDYLKKKALAETLEVYDEEWGDADLYEYYRE